MKIVGNISIGQLVEKEWRSNMVLKIVSKGKLVGKAYSKEVYLFKKAHPFRWWLGNGLKELFRWRRKIVRMRQIRKETKNDTKNTSNK